MSKNRVATEQDFIEQGADYLFIVNDLAKFEYALQSIFDFSTKGKNCEPFIWCSLIIHHRTKGTDIWTRWPALYKEGAWRHVPAYEM